MDMYLITYARIKITGKHHTSAEFRPILTSGMAGGERSTPRPAGQKLGRRRLHGCSMASRRGMAVVGDVVTRNRSMIAGETQAPSRPACSKRNGSIQICFFHGKWGDVRFISLGKRIRLQLIATTR